VSLHPGHLHAPTISTWIGWWTWDPLVIAGLGFGVALYAAGVTRLWRVAGTRRGIRPAHAVAYGAGIAVCALALLSPLDRASDVLFSAHMAQHELLMLIAAPLIVLGRPLVPALWALPRRWRVRCGRAIQRPWLAGAWRWLTSPLIAFALHAVVRWVWHLPALFDAALADERIHAVQHLMFFASAAVFWWSLIHGRYGRAGYGVAAAFVFFTMLHSGLLAAILALSDHPLYEPHATATAAWGMDALTDQQRAGLLMWVPGGVVMMASGLAMFAAWLGQASRRARRSPHPGLTGDARQP
jgi:putative membrane protein